MKNAAIFRAIKQNLGKKLKFHTRIILHYFPSKEILVYN